MDRLRVLRSLGSGRVRLLLLRLLLFVAILILFAGLSTDKICLKLSDCAIRSLNILPGTMVSSGNVGFFRF